METQLKGETMPRPMVAVLDRDLTVDQAWAIRADHARLAERCAERVDRARSAGQYGAMLRWTEEYRRAAMQCRLLGEQIRRADNGSEQTRPGGAEVLAHLPFRPGAQVPPPGKAA